MFRSFHKKEYDVNSNKEKVLVLNQADHNDDVWQKYLREGEVLQLIKRGNICPKFGGF